VTTPSLVNPNLKKEMDDPSGVILMQHQNFAGHSRVKNERRPVKSDPIFHRIDS